MKRVLSIDIGIQKTRICEVDYGKKNPHVYKCITFDTPENVIEDGYIRDKEAFAAAMKEKLLAAKMKITEVVFTIASTKIASREITIPMVKDNRIQAVVNAGAQDYFPVDVSEYNIAYSILERVNTKEDKKIKLLLLAAPSNMIKNYYSFAQVMNFKVVAIDYIGNSSFQILKRQVGTGVNLILQINEQTTLVNVINNEVLTLQRTIPYGTKSVIETILENKVFGIDFEKEAFELLCKEELIQFHSPGVSQANMSYEASTEVEDERVRLIKAKEEVTDSLDYLVSNVLRVIDYYNSKAPENKIEAVYITGQGAGIKGINRLLQSEIGYQIKNLDKLSSVNFKKNLKEINQFDYICAIGAAIKPIGFASEKEEKKSQFSMYFILGLSIFASLFMVGTSVFLLNNAKQDKKNLEEKINSMMSVVEIYDEYSAVNSKYQVIKGIYTVTDNPNEDLNALLTELEEKLPSSMVITAFNVTTTGISMNITAGSKLTAAKLYEQLSSIATLRDISIDSIAEAVDDNGITTVTFAVNCSYATDSQTSDQAAQSGQ